MNIPDSFQLFGLTIKVVYKDNLYLENMIGYASYSEQTIYLQPSIAEYPLTEDQLNQTFWHEVMHMIYHLLGKDTHDKDGEALVDLVAQLIYQTLKTGNMI